MIRYERQTGCQVWWATRVSAGTSNGIHLQRIVPFFEHWKQRAGFHGLAEGLANSCNCCDKFTIKRRKWSSMRSSSAFVPLAGTKSLLCSSAEFSCFYKEPRPCSHSLCQWLVWLLLSLLCRTMGCIWSVSLHHISVLMKKNSSCHEVKLMV